MRRRRKAKASASARKKRQQCSCVFCDLVLATSQNLECHIRSHTGERPYFCNFCDSTFNSPSSLHAHVNSIHLQIKYTCPKCRRQLKGKPSLIAHRKICRGRLFGNVKKKSGGGERGKGNVELKRVTRKKVHETDVVNEKKPTNVQNLGASPPPTAIKREEDLTTRNSPVITPTILESPSVPLPFQPIDYNFNFMANFIYQKEQEQRKWDPSFFLHLNRYDPDDTRVSPSYPAKIEKEDSPELPPPKLERRGRPPKNQESNPSTSTAKKKVVVNKSKLGKKSYDDSPHKCPQCGKGYSNKGNLLKHERIHRNEKKFVCPFCQKRFLDKCNILRHISAMHQNPEGDAANTIRGRLRCGICGETFPEISRLCKHIGSEHHEMLLISEGTEEKAKVSVGEATPIKTTEED